MPVGAETGAIGQKRRANVRRDAIDMNVQLVLASSARRVDRQADRVARQFVGQTRVEERAGRPGGAPVVGRGGVENLRALDPRDPSGGNGQILGDAVDVLQDGDAVAFAAREVDRRAGRRRAVGLLVGDAPLMDDAPDRRRIGRAPRKDRPGEEQGDERRARGERRKARLHRSARQMWIARLATAIAASLIASDMVGWACVARARSSAEPPNSISTTAS